MVGLLLIGSGAREVAIARKIKESSSPVQLYCVGSTTNPQIKDLSEIYFEQSQVVSMQMTCHHQRDQH